MRVGPIPEEVKTFLHRNNKSIDQLEILRLLGEDGTCRTWVDSHNVKNTSGPLAPALRGEGEGLRPFTTHAIEK